MSSVVHDDPTTASAVPWLSDAEQRVWRDWMFGGFAVMGQIDEWMQTHYSLSVQQFHIMVMTSEGPEQGTAMNELSMAMLLPPSSLTYQVKQLERRGLIDVRKDPHDRRVRRVRMTPVGWELLTDCAAKHVVHVREIFFSHVHDEELHSFGGVVNRIWLANAGD